MEMFGAGKAFHIYKDVGPGLLENVYEGILSDRLRQTGLYAETQKMIAIRMCSTFCPFSFFAFYEMMGTRNP